jgi:hypothetical protein
MAAIVAEADKALASVKKWEKGGVTWAGVGGDWRFVAMFTGKGDTGEVIGTKGSIIVRLPPPLKKKAYDAIQKETS